MVKVIKGKVNQFHFIGNYDYDDYDMEFALPFNEKDFIFDLKDNGDLYVTTSKPYKFLYESDTGYFFIIKEVI